VCSFFAWLEQHGIGGLVDIEPFRKSVGHAAVRKYPHVGRPEDLRLCLELDAVARGRHPADLRSHIFEPVEVHYDPTAGGIDMDRGTDERLS
jgi:hypothetical protein